MTTPECPKGPERGARPLRERVEGAIMSEDVLQPTRQRREPDYDGVTARVDAVMAVFEPELTQITFECDAADQAAHLLTQQLEDLRDDVLGDESLLVPEIVSAAGRTVERLTAEAAQLRAQLEEAKSGHAYAWNEQMDVVRALGWGNHDEIEWDAVVDAVRDGASARQHLALAYDEARSLREQLAARRLPPNASYRVAAKVMIRLMQAGFPLDNTQRNLLPQIVKDEMHALVTPVASESRAASAAVRSGAPPQGLVDDLVEFWHNNKHEGFLDDAARAVIVKWWGLELAAPQQPVAHTVLLSSDTGVMGEWQAFCSGCRQRYVGDLAHAEFWKDQHLADVLVPQLQANSKLEQNLVLDELSRQSQEFEDRPSGSGAAAPHSDEELMQRLRTLVKDLQNPGTGTKGEAYDSGFLDGQIQAEFGRSAAQAARSEATLEDPPPQPSGFKVGDEVRWCWTGANADGTWFKARLTEEHPHHYPKGWAGEITDCGTAYTDEHMGEVPLGFKLYMDIPSLTLVSRPSPLSEVSCTEQEAEK